MTEKQQTYKAGPKFSPITRRKLKAEKRRSRQWFNISWFWIGLGIVIVIVAAYLLSKPNDKHSSEITVAQAYQKYQQGAFFLDVRDQIEWNQGHIPNSINIPLTTLQDKLDELPRDQDIVVVCAHGQRSKAGLAFLQQAGFNRITCLSGGLIAWATAGYPLEEGNQ